MSPRRPTPDQVTAADDVRDWYWTRTQLDQIASRLGVSRRGNKAEVTARLVASLEGSPDPTPERPPRGADLTPPFHLDQVVPDRQRLTRAIRDWMIAQVGPQFRFDAHMRTFFADPKGRTLADAVQVWHSTRGMPDTDISAQFEYNRFTRWYRDEYPTAARADLLAAWQVYKDTPVSQRPALPD